MRKLLIKRKGYYRNGKYIKPTDFYIRDRGAKGRGKKLFEVEKGKLSQFGYSTKKSRPLRERALDRAEQVYGATSVFRSLNAQALFRKRTDGLRKTFIEDRNYIKRKYLDKVI